MSKNILKDINIKIIVLILFLLIALLFRIIFVLNIPSIPESDAAEYDNLASSLLKDEGYVNLEGQPTAFRPPLYPFFLYFIYSFFGHNYLAVKVIQAIISTLICLLIYLITKRVYKNERVSLIAIGITAIYQPFITFYFGPAYLVTEILFVFLFLVSIYLLIRYSVDFNVLSLVGAGVFLGLGMLTRGSILLFPFFVLIWFFMQNISFRKKVLSSVILVLFAFIVVLPWSIRNYFIFNKFVPISTNGGYTFYASTNRFSKGLGGDREFSFPLDNELKKIGLNEAERSNYLFKEAVDFVRSNPRKAAKLFIRKFFFFWDTTYENYRTPANRHRYNYSYAFIIPFSILGLYFSLRSRYSRQTFLFFLIIIYFTAFHSIIHSCIRFRLSIEPFLIVFASWGLYYFWEKIHKKYIYFAILFIVATLNFIIFFNYSKVIEIVKLILSPFKIQ